MSKLFRSLLALLAAMAMVLVWSGTATADHSPSHTFEECLAGLAPETCIDPADDDAGAGEGEGEGTPDDGEGEVAGTPEELTPPEEFDDSTVTQPDITRRVAENGAEDDSSAGAGEDVAAAETDESEEPDPAAVGECIAGQVEDLITSLATLLGEGFEELATGIEEELSSFDPTDPDALPTFLGGLPERIEEAGAEFSTEVEALVRGSVEGIVACLPEPPSEEPPGGDPPPEERPAQPVRHQDPHYENCDDARAQGAAPVYEGQPGYGPHLDADNDGIGCEDDTVVPVTYHSGGLAYTGTEPGPPLKLGAVLLLVGSGLLYAARRRA